MLAAVEGTTIAAPDLDSIVVPAAVVIIIVLFLFQHRGTGTIGRVFGPVMIVWFTTLAVLGVSQVVSEPSVFRAVWPGYAVDFFADNGFDGFLVLGAVILVVVGGEALYADMGHFGRRPIALGWYGLVLPSLLLMYFGQGALLIDDPEAIDNPFYRMAPDWALYPLVVLATMATVIASQALISGAFSLTRQAVQLGYSPRVRIRHTSPSEIGQIYIGSVNWVLMVACIALVVGFGESAKLAAAYGLAVSMTMVITTMLFYVVARERLGWSQGDRPARCAACSSSSTSPSSAPPSTRSPTAGGCRSSWPSSCSRSCRPGEPGGCWCASGCSRAGCRWRRSWPSCGATRRSALRTPAPTCSACRARPRRACSPPCATTTPSTSGSSSSPSSPRRSRGCCRRSAARSTDLGEGLQQVVLTYGFMEDVDVPAALAAHGVIGADQHSVSYFVGPGVAPGDRPTGHGAVAGAAVRGAGAQRHARRGLLQPPARPDRRGRDHHRAVARTRQNRR